VNIHIKRNKDLIKISPRKNSGLNTNLTNTLFDFQLYFPTFYEIPAELLDFCFQEHIFVQISLFRYAQNMVLREM
jgi:hypothetical protein